MQSKVSNSETTQQSHRSHRARRTGIPCCWMSDVRDKVPLMIELTTTVDGVLLPVQGQPGARRNAIVGEHAGRLKVAVTQVAEKGKATEAIRELIADSLGIAPSLIVIVQGDTQPKKLLRLEGVTTERVREWLEEILATDP